jgi:hypothetical protein
MRVLLLLAAVAGCGDRAPSPPPPLPAPIVDVGCGTLWDIDGLPPERDDFGTIVARGAEVMLDRFPDAPAALRRRLSTRKPTENWFVALCSPCPGATYRLGTGWSATVGIGVADDAVLDRASGFPDVCSLPLEYVWHAAWAKKTAQGWIFRPRVPAEATSDTRVVKTRAEAWVSSARRWLWVEAELDVEVRDGVIALRVPPLERTDGFWTGPPQEGLRLTLLTLDGTPVDSADAVYDANNDVLSLTAPAGHAKVKIRLEGAPSLLEGTTQSRTHQLQLSSWLPQALEPTMHPMDLIVHVPKDERLVASVTLDQRSADGEWITYGKRQDRDREPLLIVEVGPGIVPTTFSDPRLELLLNVDYECDKPEGAAMLRSVLDRLDRIAPVPKLRFTPIATFRELAGQAGDDLITLTARDAGFICREFNTAHVNLAHEIAHAWFGGQVRTVSRSAAAWWESLAEYVATSVWDDDAGRWQRRDRSNAYAALRLDDEPAAMTDEMPGRWRVPLSYGRGPLLLTALEDRIGKAKMQAALAHFIRANAGTLGSWDGVVASVAAVAGDPAAAWLRTWLDEAGAPDLMLRGIRVVDGRIRGELVQTTAFAAAVQLAVMKDGTRVATHAIDFAAPVTPFDIPAADGTQLVLDPDWRLPRKYDPAKTDDENQRTVSLR